MQSLSVFRPRIAPRVEGASDALIDQAVIDTCIDFCDRSNVVKRMADSFVTVAGRAQYDLPTLNQQSVSTVMRVWVDANEITPIDEDAIRTPFGFVSAVPGVNNPSGVPRFFNETDPGTISLYPVPGAVYTINMRASMRPMRAAKQVEDQLFEDWVDTIVDGALVRLYAMPAAPHVPFSNPGLAKVHAAAYEAGVNVAMLASRKGSTRAQSRITAVHI
jgi:hypothetical protein